MLMLSLYSIYCDWLCVCDFSIYYISSSEFASNIIYIEKKEVLSNSCKSYSNSNSWCSSCCGSNGYCGSNCYCGSNDDSDSSSDNSSVDVYHIWYV